MVLRFNNKADMTIRISPEQAHEIITGKTPLGLFHVIDGYDIIAINNSQGQAETNIFRTLSGCER